jgi:hypothetical protein
VQRLKDLAAKLFVFLKRQDEGKSTVIGYLECVSECIATFLPKRKKELTLVVDSVALLESISLEKKVDVKELVKTGVRICTAIDPSLQLHSEAAVEFSRSIQTALQIESSQDFKKLATSLIKIVELTRKEQLPVSKSVLAAIDSLSQLSFSGRSLPEGILKSTEAAASLMQTFVPESEPKLDLLKKILTTLQSFVTKESQFTRPSELISQISEIIKLISADYDESLQRIESITNSVENFKFDQLREDADESKKIEAVVSAIESVGKMLATTDPSGTNGVDQMFKVSRIFVKKVIKKKGLGAKECRLDLIEVINDLSSVLVEYDEGLALPMDKARLFANVVLRRAKALQVGINHNDFEETISSCKELILAFDPAIFEEVSQTCHSLRTVWGLYQVRDSNSDRPPLESLAYIMESTTKLVSSIDASIEPVCSIASKVSVDIYKELRETSTDGNQNHIQTICTLLTSIGKTLVNIQPEITMVLEKTVSIIRCLEQISVLHSGLVETSHTSLRICEEIAGVVAKIEPALATRTSKLATYLTAVRAAVEEGNNPAENNSAKLYKAVAALLQDMNPEIKETISKVDSCLNALLTQLRNTKKLRSDKSSELVRLVQTIFAEVDERISKKLEGVYFAVKTVEESMYSSSGDKEEEAGHYAMIQLAKEILPKYSNRLDQLERFFTQFEHLLQSTLDQPISKISTLSIKTEAATSETLTRFISALTSLHNQKSPLSRSLLFQRFAPILVRFSSPKTLNLIQKSLELVVKVSDYGEGIGGEKKDGILRDLMIVRDVFSIFESDNCEKMASILQGLEPVVVALRDGEKIDFEKFKELLRSIFGLCAGADPKELALLESTIVMIDNIISKADKQTEKQP